MTALEVTGRLRPYGIMVADDTARVFDAIKQHGGRARFVGGVVRDALLKRDLLDVDIACDLAPEETQIALEKVGIRVIPTGLKHGTVTAITDAGAYEITTLRVDVLTDGRHAEVAFTDSWLEDAKRRDFTFNAIYCDLDGTIYDPFDGEVDLRDGVCVSSAWRKVALPKISCALCGSSVFRHGSGVHRSTRLVRRHAARQLLAWLIFLLNASAMKSSNCFDPKARPVRLGI